jgi:hypothetical protein
MSPRAERPQVHKTRPYKGLFSVFSYYSLVMLFSNMVYPTVGLAYFKTPPFVSLISIR